MGFFFGFLMRMLISARRLQPQRNTHVVGARLALLDFFTSGGDELLAMQSGQARFLPRGVAIRWLLSDCVIGVATCVCALSRLFAPREGAEDLLTSRGLRQM